MLFPLARFDPLPGWPGKGQMTVLLRFFLAPVAFWG